MDDIERKLRRINAELDKLAPQCKFNELEPSTEVMAARERWQDLMCEANDLEVTLGL